MRNVFLLMQQAHIGALISKKLDQSLSVHGISFTEFSIMYHLNAAEGKELSRISLAEKVALTASGVTRILLPMEKNNLVEKRSNPRDARQSLVVLSGTGKEVMNNALKTVESASEAIFSLFDEDDFSALLMLLNKLKC